MTMAEPDATKLPASSIDAQLLAHLPAEVRVQMLHFLTGLERKGIRR